MCTLIALHRCVAQARLVVAANRDEFFDRPAEGPALRDMPYGTIVAPRDARAGGTWLGVNSHGVFAALTNRAADGDPDASRRSRGWLVLDALRAPTAAAAAEHTRGVDPETYNPFNLFVGDGTTAHVVSCAGRAECFDLEPGVHVIGNRHPSERAPDIERLRSEARGAARGRALEGLAEVCRSHRGESPLSAACVHAGAYGTRSSTLLRLGGEPALRHVDGPPCAAPYGDFTPLLHELGLGAAAREGVHSMRKVS